MIRAAIKQVEVDERAEIDDERIFRDNFQQLKRRKECH